MLVTVNCEFDSWGADVIRHTFSSGRVPRSAAGRLEVPTNFVTVLAAAHSTLTPQDELLLSYSDDFWRRTDEAVGDDSHCATCFGKWHGTGADLMLQCSGDDEQCPVSRHVGCMSDLRLTQEDIDAGIFLCPDHLSMWKAAEKFTSTTTRRDAEAAATAVQWLAPTPAPSSFPSPNSAAARASNSSTSMYELFQLTPSPAREDCAAPPAGNSTSVYELFQLTPSPACGDHASQPADPGAGELVPSAPPAVAVVRRCLLPALQSRTQTMQHPCPPRAVAGRPSAVSFSTPTAEVASMQVAASDTPRASPLLEHPDLSGACEEWTSSSGNGSEADGERAAEYPAALLSEDACGSGGESSAEWTVGDQLRSRSRTEERSSDSSESRSSDSRSDSDENVSDSHSRQQGRHRLRHGPAMARRAAAPAPPRAAAESVAESVGPSQPRTSRPILVRSREQAQLLPRYNDHLLPLPQSHVLKLSLIRSAFGRSNTAAPPPSKRKLKLAKGPAAESLRTASRPPGVDVDDGVAPMEIDGAPAAGRRSKAHEATRNRWCAAEPLAADFAEFKACCGARWVQHLRTPEQVSQHSSDSALQLFRVRVLYRVAFASHDAFTSHLSAEIVRAHDVATPLPTNSVCPLLNWDGGRVCVSCFRAVHGIGRTSMWSYCKKLGAHTVIAAQQQLSPGVLVTSFGRMRRGRRGPRGERIRDLILAHVREHGQTLPNAKGTDIEHTRYILPVNSLRDLIAKLAKLDPTCTLPESSVRHALRKLRRQNKITISFAKTKELAQCDDCARLDKVLADIPPHERAKQVALQIRKDKHLSEARQQRDLFDLRKEFAKRYPWTAWTITFDGLEQKKSQLPHAGGRASKMLSDLPLLQVHAVGAFCFGAPVPIVGVLNFPDVIKDSDLSVTILERLLDLQWSKLEEVVDQLAAEGRPPPGVPPAVPKSKMREAYPYDSVATAKLSDQHQGAQPQQSQPPADHSMQDVLSPLPEAAAASHESPGGSASAEYTGVGHLWPARLHLSFDNAGGEAKNQWMFRFLGLLVLHDVFECVTVNTCLVGHTHSICDQLFSVWAKLLRINDAPTFSAMKKLFHDRYSSKVASLIKLMRNERLSEEEADVLGMHGAVVQREVDAAAAAAQSVGDSIAAAESLLAEEEEWSPDFLRQMEQMAQDLHGEMASAGQVREPVQPHIVHQAFSMNIKGWLAAVQAHDADADSRHRPVVPDAAPAMSAAAASATAAAAVAAGPPSAPSRRASACSIVKAYPMHGQQIPHVFAVERDRDGDVYLYSKWQANSTEWKHNGLQHHFHLQETGSYSERCLLFRAADRHTTAVDPASNPPMPIDTDLLEETITKFASMGVVKSADWDEWNPLLAGFKERGTNLAASCKECARITGELNDIGVVRGVTKSTPDPLRKATNDKIQKRAALRRELDRHLSTNAAAHAPSAYSADPDMEPQDSAHWFTKWVERARGHIRPSLLARGVRLPPLSSVDELPYHRHPQHLCAATPAGSGLFQSNDRVAQLYLDKQGAPAEGHLVLYRCAVEPIPEQGGEFGNQEPFGVGLLTLDPLQAATAQCHRPAAPPPAAPTVAVGNLKLKVGKQLVEMQDSTDLYRSGDFGALLARLEEQGFLFVKGVLPSATVAAAQQSVLAHLRSKKVPLGHVGRDESTLQPGKSLPGWTVDAQTGTISGDREEVAAVSGWKALGTSPPVADVYNGPLLKSFFERLFGTRAQAAAGGRPVDASPASGSSRWDEHGADESDACTMLPQYTWLRVKGSDEVTAEHVDFFYFYNNTDMFTGVEAAPGPAAAAAAAARAPHIGNQQLPFYTCWIPLSSVEANFRESRLALIPGSHRLRGYEAPVRNKDEPLLPSQCTRTYLAKQVWASPSRMELGDVIVFSVQCVHAATRNHSDRIRLSIDTRLQAHRSYSSASTPSANSTSHRVRGRPSASRFPSIAQQDVSALEAAAEFAAAAQSPATLDTVFYLERQRQQRGARSLLLDSLPPTLTLEQWDLPTTDVTRLRLNERRHWSKLVSTHAAGDAARTAHRSAAEKGPSPSEPWRVRLFEHCSFYPKPDKQRVAVSRDELILWGEEKHLLTASNVLKAAVWRDVYLDLTEEPAPAQRGRVAKRGRGATVTGESSDDEEASHCAEDDAHWGTDNAQPGDDIAAAPAAGWAARTHDLTQGTSRRSDKRSRGCREFDAGERTRHEELVEEGKEAQGRADEHHDPSAALSAQHLAGDVARLASSKRTRRRAVPTPQPKRVLRRGAGRAAHAADAARTPADSAEAVLDEDG
jgi:hypothetical protein